MPVSSNVSGTQNFKVVLLGEGCVGKTSIVLRYVEDKFNNNHISTVQVKIIPLCPCTWPVNWVFSGFIPQQKNKHRWQTN